MVELGRCLTFLLALGLVSSCASATQRGQTLYVEGRLIEAAEVFEHCEESLNRYNPRERVSYGLYRGVTLLRLGDLDGAGRWLHFAQQAESHEPGSIAPEDVLTLKLALSDLDRRRSLTTPAVDPWTDVVAHAAENDSPAGPDVVVPPETTTPPPRTSAPKLRQP
jgi:hypothetical protein